MNKFLYLTKAVEATIYEEGLLNGNIFINPSNQNFHKKMIETLSLIDSTTVISFNHVKSTTNSSYNYVHLNTNKLKKYTSGSKQYIKQIESLSSYTHCFFDPLNVEILLVAKRIMNKYKNIKMIPIITDNPENITNTSRLYRFITRKILKTFNYYICLNEELNNLFNTQNKSNITLHGIAQNIDEVEPIKNKKEYYFFGGALYEMYGIVDLITSFIQLNDSSIELLIAGHGPLVDYIEAISTTVPNVKYIGLLSPNTISTYIKGSIAVINPRPINEKIDKESIPSKLIDYLYSMTPVISTTNYYLYNEFKECAIWYDNNDGNTLLSCLKKFSTMESKQLKKMARDAYKICNNKYSTIATSIQIKTYLDSL